MISFFFLLHFNRSYFIHVFFLYYVCFFHFYLCVYRNIKLHSCVEFSPFIEILQNDILVAFSLNKAWKRAGFFTLLFPCVHRMWVVFLTDLLWKEYWLSEAFRFSAPSFILLLLFASGNRVFLSANRSKVFIDPHLCHFRQFNFMRFSHVVNHFLCVFSVCLPEIDAC